MRTEIDIQQDLRKLYAERAKIRKTIYAEYVGKCYFFNDVYYFIESINEKDTTVLIVSEVSIQKMKFQLDLLQIADYEITKEKFIQELEKRVDLIIKQVKGE